MKWFKKLLGIATEPVDPLKPPLVPVLNGDEEWYFDRAANKWVILKKRAPSSTSHVRETEPATTELPSFPNDNAAAVASVMELITTPNPSDETMKDNDQPPAGWSADPVYVQPTVPDAKPVSEPEPFKPEAPVYFAPEPRSVEVPTYSAPESPPPVAYEPPPPPPPPPPSYDAGGGGVSNDW